MATIKCGVFVIALAVFAAQECHGSGEYGHNYGKHGHNYGKHGHKHGGGNYGGGGGHYAIGFGDEDIRQLCGTDADCGTCFRNSQNVTGNARTLSTRDAAQCARQYAPSAAWTSVCNDYADSLDLAYPNGVPDNAVHMLSFCYRTAGEFAAASRCDDKIGGDWSIFYDCFGVRHGGSGHKGGKGSREGGKRGSKESGEKEGEGGSSESHETGGGSRRRRDYSDDFGAVERLIRE